MAKQKANGLKKKAGDWKVMGDNLRDFLNKDIPIQSAFRLARFLRVLNQEMITLEETRRKLVAKYGDPPNEKGDVNVPENKVAEFVQEYNKVLEEEITIEWNPMPISELGEIKVSSAEMMVLYDLFTE